MQTVSEAILIQVRPFGDDKYLATVFSKQLGKFSGMVKGGKKKAAELQIGNVVEVERFRRLETQLGTLVVDSLHNPSSAAFNNLVGLQVVHYLCEMLGKGLREGDAHIHLYEATKQLLKSLDQEDIWQRIALYELQFLASTGYGVSLSEDNSVREEGDDSPLKYVSPKSGRAVSEQAGEPYKHKLLLLPELFGGKSKDFLDVFKLSGHFLCQAFPEQRFEARRELINLGRTSEFKS